MVYEKIENRMVVDSEWTDHKPVLHCDDCGSGIMSEESYYDICGDIICEQCIDDYVILNFRKYG